MNGFDTTRWSLVLNARKDSAGARDALERLCRTYRSPVLSYVRRRGFTADAAEDLVQAFFLRFIEHAYHARADPARGRFRAFLLTAVKRFMVDHYAELHSLKRGGRYRFETLDSGSAVRVASMDDPDAAFQRDWAMAVLDSALTQMREEARQLGKLALFDELSGFLIERPDDTDYARVAEALNLRRNTVAVAVHRMRHRLRDLVRLEIGETAANPAELAQELRDMHAALGETLNHAAQRSPARSS
ncbi:MAG TPA: sigma-70 family RNA polymerase sigma factor [Dokdonella sp.]|nr:sigma-70 family RNA polymerase sigma factor [Dokdonella sp.]